jgi:hypothetical protein
VEVRARAVLLVAATAVVAIAVLAGCSDDGAQDGRPRQTSARAPALGGPVPRQHRPPHRAMNRLERPVAERLARQVAGEDLTLDFLDCPRWNGTVPSTMTCRGYVEGLVTQVRVHLLAAAGGHIGFDARISTGVVATRRLVDTLNAGGWTAVDCGDVAAYPATVGGRIVCRVHRGGRTRYVVATVRSPAGRVTIADYPSTAAAR